MSENPKYIKPTFSINSYDYEGDVIDHAIFLDVGVIRVRVADSIEDFDLFIKHLQKISTEIKENY